jgi:tetratricopeptide (TPR) repeat protein
MAAWRHRRAGRALLAAAACALAAPAAAFTCEAAGGRAWREVTSEHFAVRTDLDADEAAALAQDLERIRGAVVAALFPGRADVPGRLGVVAFRSAGDFEDLAPAHVAAFYASLGPEERAIVLPAFPVPAAGRDARTAQVVAHELAHHLLAYALPRRPAWLDEGLASLLEPLGTLRPGEPVEVGRVPSARHVRRRKDRVPEADLLAWSGRWEQLHMERHYDTAWLLVHYLFTRHPEETFDLLRRLGRGEEPGAAWAASFPRWDPGRPGALDDLEGELDRYGRAPALPFRRLPGNAVPAAPAVASDRHLPPAAVHALRIRLWPYRQSERAAAALRAEVAEALGEDPAAPDALAMRARLDGTDPAAAARVATAAHPDDPRAWQLLAVALERGPVEERLAARRRAAALAPDDPAVLAGLARDLVAAGHSGMALPLVRRLLAIAPYSWGAHAAAAAVASDLGACADAVSLQRRALDLLPDRGSGAARAGLEASLAAYERQCAPSPETETPRPVRGGASSPAVTPGVRD